LDFFAPPVQSYAYIIYIGAVPSMVRSTIFTPFSHSETEAVAWASRLVPAIDPQLVSNVRQMHATQ
jgi:uncharacterized membrane protein YjjB (DUF3815 family)